MSDIDQAASTSDDARRSFVAEFQAFTRLVLKRFGQDQCMRIAAALSYTTLLALVPWKSVV